MDTSAGLRNDTGESGFIIDVSKRRKIIPFPNTPKVSGQERFCYGANSSLLNDLIGEDKQFMLPLTRRSLTSLALTTLALRKLPSRVQAQASPKRYIGHAARLTAEIPRDWTVGVTTVGSSPAYDYEGASGFVACLPVPAQTLAEACSFVAASSDFSAHPSTITRTTWSDQPAGRVDGQINAAPASALVVPHPYPFDLLGKWITYAAVIADPDHLTAISQTLSFSPDLVTPELYITSILDLVEARAYWSGKVDWDAARKIAYTQIEGLTDVGLAIAAVAGIIERLREVGDNHSGVRTPDQNANLGSTSGVGFLVGGRRVLVVFPDSPADRAGLRAGDVIETVDGRTFSRVANVTEPSSLLGVRSQLTVTRAGTPDPITLTIDEGPYNQYLPPAGRRLLGDLGYLQVPYFVTPGKGNGYVAAASAVVTAVDQSPVQGWVVDLRLNSGGAYSPMITAVGPMLGDGAFLGWRWPEGRQTWVTYVDGRILDDGVLVDDEIDPATAPVHLHQANPPVAVLTGPLTASAGYPLFDGTTLVLAEVAMTDRVGELHLQGIEPDELVDSDWDSFGSGDDPVLHAAIEWLAQQAALPIATPIA